MTKSSMDSTDSDDEPLLKMKKRKTKEKEEEEAQQPSSKTNKSDSSDNEALSCKKKHGAKTSLEMKLELTDVLLTNEKISNRISKDIDNQNQTSESETRPTKKGPNRSKTIKKGGGIKKKTVTGTTNQTEPEISSSDDNVLSKKKKTISTKKGKKPSVGVINNRLPDEGESSTKTKKSNGSQANSSFTVSSISSSSSSISSDEDDEDLKLAKISIKNNNNNNEILKDGSDSNEIKESPADTNNNVEQVTNNVEQVTNNVKQVTNIVEKSMEKDNSSSTSNTILKDTNCDETPIQTSGKRKNSGTTDTSLIDTDNNSDHRSQDGFSSTKKDAKRKPLKKRRRKTSENTQNKVAQSSGKENKVVKSKEDSVKLKNLKRYLNLSGYKVLNYNKLFQDCNTMKSKESKIMSMLEELGIKGRPTLKQCKKIRKKREEAAEVAELNIENVITASGGRTRSSRRSSVMQQKKYDFTGLTDCIDNAEVNGGTDGVGDLPTPDDPTDGLNIKMRKRSRLVTTSSSGEDVSGEDVSGD